MTKGGPTPIKLHERQIEYLVYGNSCFLLMKSVERINPVTDMTDKKCENLCLAKTDSAHSSHDINIQQDDHEEKNLILNIVEDFSEWAMSEDLNNHSIPPW